MKPLRKTSLVEQTAEHLREGFRTGRWSGKLPGVLSLSQALGVSRDTIREAVWLLEEQGVLKATGAGKSRLIVPGRKKDTHRRILRVGLMLHSPLNQENSHSQELILSIKHGIEDSGHAFVICGKSIEDLGNDVSRMARAIHEVQADAWIVYGGTRELCEWFVAMPLPVLAIGGRFQGLPIAATRTNLTEAMNDAIDTLAERGHRRIVFIAPSLWRQPSLSPVPQTMLDRMEHHRLQPNAQFNVPDWQESPEGLLKLLKALYLATPPTALLLGEPAYVLPTLTFLTARGLSVPEQVSLITLLPDPALAWYRPQLAHFEWPIPPHVHRTVRWVNDIAHGEADKKATEVSAKFVPAGTIGSAMKK